MNKRHYEHTLPNIRGSLSNTYKLKRSKNIKIRNYNVKYLSFYEQNIVIRKLMSNFAENNKEGSAVRLH